MPRTHRFAVADSGSIGLLFALMLMGLFGVVGVAVDFARAQSAQNSLQQDVDRLALFIGAQAYDGRQTVNVKTAAQDYLNGLSRQKSAVGQALVEEASASDGVVRARATVAVPTAVMQLFGFKSLQVEAVAEAELGEQPVEVALVLDNTLSMTGSKIDALKAAAHDLIETAFAPPNADRFVKIGIVPFADYVNVGLQYRNRPWLSVLPDQTTSEPMCWLDPTATKLPGTCRNATTMTSVDGSSPTSWSGEVCRFERSSQSADCATSRDFTWHGCVGSRNYPLDTLDEQYNQRIPGILNVQCSAPLTPLSADRADLRSKIDDMFVIGETYIPAGLMWGWRVLSDEEPFSEGVPYGQSVNGKTVRKILVLMTDGRNSVSPFLEFHTGLDVALADSRTSEVCTNIKARGIQIYTVAFDVDDDAIKDVLRDCASAPGNYFDTGGAAQLRTAFQTIAKDFAPLRLTR
jgi:Flp pilus assembly protein TadG